MNHPTKYYKNAEDFNNARRILSSYQKTHNIIRKDYLNLLDITRGALQNQKSFNTLYRACIRELFSLIESDLYSLNGLDPYRGYHDYDGFKSKFKKTIKQVFKTWEKEDLQKKYFDQNLEQLFNFLELRDKITHPKSPDDFKDAILDDVDKVAQVFQEYRSLIHKLMDDFFIGINEKPV